MEKPQHNDEDPIRRCVCVCAFVSSPQPDSINNKFRNNKNHALLNFHRNDQSVGGPFVLLLLFGVISCTFFFTFSTALIQIQYFIFLFSDVRTAADAGGHFRSIHISNFHQSPTHIGQAQLSLIN